jgi:hypothetical protein
MLLPQEFGITVLRKSQVGIDKVRESGASLTVDTAWRRGDEVWPFRHRSCYPGRIVKNRGCEAG